MYLLGTLVHISLLTLLQLIRTCKTEFSHSRGHYPSSYCMFSDVIFSSESKSFHYQSELTLHNQCYGVQDIWPLANSSTLNHSVCSEGNTYDVGHVYTIYYWAGGSNYFHLHYDMMIPLFSALHLNDGVVEIADEAVQLFMPTVETSRLKMMDWNTKAFDNMKKYWMEMTQVIAGAHRIKPMNMQLLKDENILCFKKIFFGTKSVRFDDPNLIKGYVSYVKKSLGTTSISRTSDRLAVIHRHHRRRILNEDELLNALNEIAPTDLVEFSGLSFKEQVQLVQKYSVLIGMNGAGLTNALYLQPHAVAVQLVPYQAQLNYREFASMLGARGPYLEWHNKHENMTREMPHDTYRHNSDTIIHVTELRDLVLQALNISHTTNQQPPHIELQQPSHIEL